jgi:4-amino-4-deoxy-L-arabinose transferase-like glycosyltransferase
MAKKRSAWHAFLLLLIALGVIARGFSVHWNFFPHGDVVMDMEAAQSLVTDGKLMEEGKPLAQHGPVWAVLGGAVTTVTNGSALFSLRVLSFISGIILIALTWMLGKKFLSKEGALAAAAFVSITAVLIDYSGNGSFYAAQACLYLLWALIAMRKPSTRTALMLGVITGVSYLLNFQSIILFPATIIVTIARARGSNNKLMQTIVAMVVGFLIISPWLIRNAQIFGDPFYSHAVNQTYLFMKAGMNDLIEGDAFHPTFAQWLSVLPGMLMTWLPNNLYYVLRKLLVLAPILSIVAIYGAVDIAFCPRRLMRIWPILLILTMHLLISAAWPVMKFRYFVPLLPFVLLLAFEHLDEFPASVRAKRILIGISAACFAVIAVLTYRSVPTHTTYFDGAITQDAYHGHEERTFLIDHHILPVP